MPRLDALLPRRERRWVIGALVAAALVAVALAAAAAGGGSADVAATGDDAAPSPPDASGSDPTHSDAGLDASEQERPGRHTRGARELEVDGGADRAEAATPAVQRVTDGLLALYDFSGEGNTVQDRVGDLDLMIAEPDAVTWGGGLHVNEPTIIASDGPPEVLYDAILGTEEFTVEAWVTPANDTQSGPARIVTLGRDTSTHNFLVGQGAHEGPADLVEMRLHERSGDYRLRTAEGSLPAAQIHLVVTRSVDGTVRVYLDGQLASEQDMADSLDGWDTTFELGLAQELDGQRSWLGTYHLLALYDRALDDDDIEVNHAAGPGAAMVAPGGPSSASPDTGSDGEDASSGGAESDGATGEPQVQSDLPADATWQQAWDARDPAVLRAWYDANAGIAAAGLSDSQLEPVGSVQSEHDGQVIEGLLVDGNIQITHDDVTVRNTKIVSDGGWYAISVPHDRQDGVSRLTIENVSIEGFGADHYRTAIMHWPGQQLTVERVHIRGHGGGMRVHSGSRVSYTYIGEIQTHAGSHNAGMSTRGGDDFVIARNYIEGSTSSALSLYSDSTISNFTARENLFDGGTYSVHGGYNKAAKESLHNVRFLDNRFTRNYQYGPRATWSSSAPGNEWTGNTYVDDGSPAG